MIAKTSWGAESVFFVSLLGKVGKVGRSWMFHQVKRNNFSCFWTKGTAFQGQTKAWKLQPAMAAE